MNRRDFLRRSGAATALAIVAPTAIASVEAPAAVAQVASAVTNPFCYTLMGKHIWQYGAVLLDADTRDEFFVKKNTGDQIELELIRNTNNRPVPVVNEDTPLLYWYSAFMERSESGYPISF